MKIGQEVVMEKDFEIKTIGSGKVITVKKGNRGFLDSKGRVHLINGEGKGKIIKVENIKLKGYDYENIAIFIYWRNFKFVFNDFRGSSPYFRIT